MNMKIYLVGLCGFFFAAVTCDVDDDDDDDTCTRYLHQMMISYDPKLYHANGPNLITKVYMCTNC